MKKMLGILGFIVPTFASASITALNVMPISDTLAHREAGITYVGAASQHDNRYGHTNGLQIGLFDRAEVGFDNDFFGKTVWNAKLNLFENPKFAPGTSLSIGAMNCHQDNKTDWFAVGRKDFANFRLHGGFMLNDGVKRGMFGIDFAFGEECTLMIEHIAGANEYSWGGVSYAPKALPGITIGAAIGLPNRKSDGTQHYLTAGYGFRF